MSDLVRHLLPVLGMFRIAIGLAPFLAAAPMARLLGFPVEHDTATARLFGRFFGVRDAGLGVLAFWAAGHPEVVGFVCLFNAAMDGGDLVSTALPLVRRQGIDRGALLSGVCAAIGGVSWLVTWWLARVAV